jgi:hypothetical protein
MRCLCVWRCVGAVDGSDDSKELDLAFYQVTRVFLHESRSTLTTMMEVTEQQDSSTNRVKRHRAIVVGLGRCPAMTPHLIR